MKIYSASTAFRELLARGYRIEPASLGCGGKYAWLWPRPSGAFTMVGCVCHTDVVDLAWRAGISPLPATATETAEKGAGHMVLRYIELVDEFIRDHDRDRRWSPFSRIEVAAIGLFARWLDRRRAEEDAILDALKDHRDSDAET